MKAAKVFWGHLVLWTGGVFAVSILLSWLLRSLPLSHVPVYQSLVPWVSALATPYLDDMPAQANAIQRLILALTIAAYPAGLAAARLMDAPRRIWSFTLSALLPVMAVAFLLIGYVHPNLVREDNPGMPPARQGADYFYFHELPHRYSVLQARADSITAARYPKFWAMFPDMARSVASRGRTTHDQTAEKALAFRNYIRFTLAMAVVPALLALIGLCLALWTRATTRPYARLQSWLGALVLVVALQRVLSVQYPYGGWYWVRWPWSTSILFPPLLLALPLAWTVFLARDRLFRPETPAVAGQAVRSEQIGPETVGA